MRRQAKISARHYNLFALLSIILQTQFRKKIRKNWGKILHTFLRSITLVFHEKKIPPSLINKREQIYSRKKKLWCIEEKIITNNWRKMPAFVREKYLLWLQRGIILCTLVATLDWTILEKMPILGRKACWDLRGRIKFKVNIFSYMCFGEFFWMKIRSNLKSNTSMRSSFNFWWTFYLALDMGCEFKSLSFQAPFIPDDFIFWDFSTSTFFVIHNCFCKGSDLTLI